MSNRVLKINKKNAYTECPFIPKLLNWVGCKHQNKYEKEPHQSYFLKKQ